MLSVGVGERDGTKRPRNKTGERAGLHLIIWKHRFQDLFTKTCGKRRASVQRFGALPFDYLEQQFISKILCQKNITIRHVTLIVTMLCLQHVSFRG